MVRTPEYPTVEYELMRLRKLKKAGFDHFTKIPALDALCEEANANFGTKIAAATALTEEMQVLMARVGVDSERTPRKITFCNYTVLEDVISVVLDTSQNVFTEKPSRTCCASKRYPSLSRPRD